MRPRLPRYLLLVCGLALTACATPYGQARSALAKGDYGEAAAHFEQVLAREPDRLDALTGLGIARYKLGAYDEAAETLARVVTRAPRQAPARLYLGLSALRKGEVGTAEEQLSAFRDLRPDPRLAAPVDRALRLMRGDPLTDELRQFIAATLEDQATLVRELDATKERLHYARPVYVPYVRCFSSARGRIVCF